MIPSSSKSRSIYTILKILTNSCKIPSCTSFYPIRNLWGCILSTLLSVARNYQIIFFNINLVKNYNTLWFVMSPGVWSKSCPLSWWCQPTISFYVTHFSRPQSFPASESFPMSWLFTSGVQSNGASASVSILPMNIGAYLMTQMVKNLPVMQGTWVRSLGWEDPLEKGIATHSSILVWRIPWTEEPSGLKPIGSQRVRHDWATKSNTIMFSS